MHQEQSAQSDDLVWRLFVLCGSNEGQGAREDKTRAEKESERRGNQVLSPEKGNRVACLFQIRINASNTKEINLRPLSFSVKLVINIYKSST